MLTMTDYDFDDVLPVPFPFTDQTTTKKRPAIVVGLRLQASGNLLGFVPQPNLPSCLLKMTDNWLNSLTNYSRFVAELLHRPTVVRSTVAVWSDSPYTGIKHNRISAPEISFN